MGRFGRPAEDDIKQEKKASHLNAVFLVKLFQRVKRLSSLQRHPLNFLKNRVSSSFSLFYTFGEFLTKSLKITHLICY